MYIFRNGSTLRPELHVGGVFFSGVEEEARHLTLVPVCLSINYSIRKYRPRSRRKASRKSRKSRGEKKWESCDYDITLHDSLWMTDICLRRVVDGEIDSQASCATPSESTALSVWVCVRVCEAAIYAGRRFCQGMPAYPAYLRGTVCMYVYTPGFSS